MASKLRQALAIVALVGGILEAQEVQPAKLSFSGSLGMMVSDLSGYGGGISLRRMREGKSIDLALDGAYYMYEKYDAGEDGMVRPGVLALTGTAIWQRPGSRLSLLGGAGVYRFSLGSVGSFTTVGPHIGLGVRLGSRLVLENRIAFTKGKIGGEEYDIPLQPILLRFTF